MSFNSRHIVVLHHGYTSPNLGFSKLFQPVHFHIRQKLMKHVQLWLKKDHLGLDRTKNQARIVIVVKIVASQFMVILRRLQ